MTQEIQRQSSFRGCEGEFGSLVQATIACILKSKYGAGLPSQEGMRMKRRQYAARTTNLMRSTPQGPRLDIIRGDEESK